ncbi:MAG: hypothetical protein R3C53_00800 [Pirellulaceae bacterium]
MSDRNPLVGQALNWASWDQTNVITAMLSSVLAQWGRENGVTMRLTRVESISHFADHISHQIVGLAAWSVWDVASLESVCGSLAAIGRRADSPTRVCYVAPELAGSIGLLAEAGAQIVTDQQHDLQSGLMRVLGHCRLTNHGFHPLTRGLVDRLPWPGVNS